MTNWKAALHSERVRLDLLPIFPIIPMERTTCIPRQMVTYTSIALAVSAVVYTAVIWFFFDRLPPTIACHFDRHGGPDGWTSPATFVTHLTLLTLAVPVFVTGLMFVLRFAPSKYLNVPNPDYWRKPENYRVACDYLFRTSLWFASAFLLWSSILAGSVFAANLSEPVRLQNWAVWTGSAILLLATFVWTGAMLRFFFKSEPVESTGEAR